MNEYYKGKTAWVTGSSRGLGRCIAEMLAEAGCNVVISGRNQTNLQSSGEGNSVDEAAAEIAEKYGVRCIAVCGGNKTGGGGFSAYSVAKSAVHQYTRLLAANLRHDGIPVNCIIPGNINTPSTRIRFGGDREKPVEGLSRLEHVGKPEDIAHLAVFLCGPGGEYISGQMLRVDGAEQLSPC